MMNTKHPRMCSTAAAGLCLAAAAGVALAAQPPAVQISPERVPMQPMRPDLQVAYNVACRVQGTPVEFPNDITIINNGPATVPAGTKLHWWMTKPAKQGDHVLGSDLPANKHVLISNAIPGGLPAGMSCGVKVVP
jgi:hypothetical protein